eukprot:2704094-Amphidinium_carterae.1
MPASSCKGKASSAKSVCVLMDPGFDHAVQLSIWRLNSMNGERHTELTKAHCCQGLQSFLGSIRLCLYYYSGTTHSQGPWGSHHFP